MSFAIITPVYEDLDALNILLKDIASEFGDSAYIIVVDDGSINNPVNISCIIDAGLKGVVISLKRNVGHQKSIAVGLNYLSDNLDKTNNLESVVIMDSDGEDKPSSINKLLEPLKTAKYDVVVAQRAKRVETLKFRLFYAFYKKIIKFFSGRKIDFGNFMALKISSIDRLVSMQELWTHVAGCVVNSKLRIYSVPIDRGRRYAGQSKMNFVDLSLHGFKVLMIFAEDVLVRVGIACALIALMTIVGAIFAVILKIIGFATPGWFSIALGVLFLVFLQTGALALITLMLTGVAKEGVSSFEYKTIVKAIQY